MESLIFLVNLCRPMFIKAFSSDHYKTFPEINE